MRTVRGIKYEIIKESDVDQENIYAFQDRYSVTFLCRKDSEFFWKPLDSVNHVWHTKYKTIEEAIDGVLEIQEYNHHKCGPIMEFGSPKEFFNWAHEVINKTNQ